MRVWPALAVFTVLLSGCAADGAPAAAPLTAAAQPRGPSSIDLTDGTAAIEGYVTDVELVGIPGATVQIVDEATRTDSQHLLTTDENGGFAVRGLAAGTYLVFAGRIGYQEGKAQRVEVVDEETARVNIVLAALAVLQAHHTGFTYVWEPTFAHANRIGTGGQGNGCTMCTGKDTAAYDAQENASGPLMTLVVESRWTANAAFCNPQMQTNVFSPDEPKADIGARKATNPYYFNNEPNVTNPTRLFISREGQGTHAVLSEERTAMNRGVPLNTTGLWKVHTQLYPTPIVPGGVGYSCALELRVETWVTAFHVEPAAPIWSALPDR